ncbi:ARM repeat-containing protein [Basidiobolus meristosporus CBS 931.73]|uniref:ARM repeat-containing protein n=1 Tax=Basidiobolus meristosporus CBS 931.73 TaxID=1314790 RepID=A0A1Y1Z8W2_9FUNG|nr:ARM repeat-containing protein [Basidiobolus meristosporus CBS 931.73]|eukprot:ORY06720.1 ARM repeat-containing protein [Basidiobolus meristosporus CBS 931.73]
MSTEDDFTALPLEEKLTHKSWKARLNGYEDLTKHYKTCDPEDVSEYNQFTHFLSKAALDANMAAQEAGLTAIVIYFQNGQNFTCSHDDIISAVIEKGLSSSRAGTKSKAVDILLLLVEIGSGETVNEQLVNALNHKLPKLVATAILALKEIVRSFGCKSVNPKPILKALPKAFAHTDKNVRAEGTQLAVELYKWLGDALHPCLAELKPVQIKELNEAFEQLPKEKPTPARLLRSEQKGNLDILDGQNGEGDQPMDVEEPEIDAFSLADPIDVLSKIPSDFYTNLESSKWKDRKEALESFILVVRVPKISPGDYRELVSALAKRIGDVNIMVGTLATQCIEALAIGLRQEFSQYSELVLNPLLEKLKEKKANFVEALRNCLDSVFIVISFSDIMEESITALAHKNPQIKAETNKWLTRCVKETKYLPSKSDVNWIVDSALKCLDDSDTSVREAAAELLGTMMKVVGERAMITYLEKVDKIKEGKIREFYEKAEVKAKKPLPSAIPPKSNSSGGQAPSKPPAAKRLMKEPSRAVTSSEPVMKPKPVSKPPVKRVPSKSVVKPKTTSALPARKPAAAPAKPSAAPKAEEPIRFKYTSEDFEEKAMEIIPSEVYAGFSDSNWKNRLASMETLTTFLENPNNSAIESELVIRALAKKPGWKETNFQVSSKMYGVIQVLCEKSSTFSRGCGALVVPGLAEKLGDIKLRKPSGDCLTSIAEQFSLQFVLHQAYESWKKAKSPKVHSECLGWINATIQDFGVASLNVRELIEFLKVMLGSSNAAVRTNSVTLLGLLSTYIGPQIRSLVQDLSPSLLSTVDAEFAKVADQKPPEPTKGVKPSGGNGGKEVSMQDVLDDAIPRVDISSQISSKILKDMRDSNWKVRKESLDQVQGILEAANKRIKPQVGDLLNTMKDRILDSNKIIQSLALDICGTIAVAMGKPFEKQSRIVLSQILMCLADSKVQTRQSALKTLDSVSEVCNLNLLIPVIANSLVQDSPTLRKDLTCWLNEKLETCFEKDSESNQLELSSLVRPTLQCLQDRNSEIRKSATTLIEYVIRNGGYTLVKDKVSDLPGASRQTILPIIESLNKGGSNEMSKQTNSSLRTNTAPTAKPRPTSSAAISSQAPVERKRELSVRPPISERASVSRVNSSESITRPQAARLGATPKDSPITSAPSSKGTPRRVETKKSLPIAFDQETPLTTNDPRAKSLRGDKDKGPSKWVFETPRQEHIDMLSEQMKPHLSPGIHQLMFSTGINASKGILDALNLLDECIVNKEFSGAKYQMSKEEMDSRFINNSDILLKYVSLRLFDTNTSILLKCTDFLEHFIALMDQQTYCFTDYEASAFLPIFIGKLGYNNDVLRARSREILKKFCRIYPASKIFTLIVDHGLKSKSSRTRADCLEEIGVLIRRNGLSVCNPAKNLPVIASFISDKDSLVRNAALNTIVETQNIVGESVLKYTGQLSNKEQTMLEERLKRSKPPSYDATGANGQGPMQRHPMLARTLPLSRFANRTSNESLSSVKSVTTTNTLPKPHQAPSIYSSSSTASSVSSDRVDSPESFSSNPSGKNSPELLSKAFTSLTISNKPDNADHSQDAGIPQPAKVDVQGLVDAVMCSDEDDRLAIAIKQVSHCLSDDKMALLPVVNTLISALLSKLKVEPEAMQNPGWLKRSKNIMTINARILARKELVRVISPATLRKLFDYVLILLVVDTLPKSSDPLNPQPLERSLNVVIMKLLENAHPEHLFEVLFDMYTLATHQMAKEADPVAWAPYQHLDSFKFFDLVQKCLWKLSRTLPTHVTSIQEPLAVNTILKVLHQFVETFIQNRDRLLKLRSLNADPFPTVRVVLVPLVNSLGEKLLQILENIEHSEQTLVPLVQTLLDKRRPE